MRVANLVLLAASRLALALDPRTGLQRGGVDRFDLAWLVSTSDSALDQS
jgi:hypothetical protein